MGRGARWAKRPPKVWLQAGAATIYAHRYDAAGTNRDHAQRGNRRAREPGDSASDEGEAWERAVNEVVLPATRKVILRTSISDESGARRALAIMLGLVRRGLGERWETSRQYGSWIQDDDLWCRRFAEADRTRYAGRAGQPDRAREPLPNAEFMQVQKQAWGIRLRLPARMGVGDRRFLPPHRDGADFLKSRRGVPELCCGAGSCFRLIRLGRRGGGGTLRAFSFVATFTKR